MPKKYIDQITSLVDNQLVPKIKKEIRKSGLILPCYMLFQEHKLESEFKFLPWCIEQACGKIKELWKVFKTIIDNENQKDKVLGAVMVNMCQTDNELHVIITVETIDGVQVKRIYLKDRNPKEIDAISNWDVFPFEIWSGFGIYKDLINQKNER